MPLNITVNALASANRLDIHITREGPGTLEFRVLVHTDKPGTQFEIMQKRYQAADLTGVLPNGTVAQFIANLVALNDKAVTDLGL